MVGQIKRTIRNVRRVREILSVLVRNGFQDVVLRTRLDQWVGAGLSLVGARPPRADVEQLPAAVRVRKVLEELGPTFIKLGQVLSTRPDLVPAAWAEEFAHLQDQCPQLDFAVIRERLEEEFPGRLDEIFESIEPEALAAASMAQVHRGMLKDGTPVAVKVLRPGTRPTIEADMDVLSTLAEFVERHFAELGYSPKDVVREFARELQREVDLLHEGRATDRLQRYFEDEDRVVFPKVHWEASTRNVLTLEEIQGTPLSRIGPEDLTPAERRMIVETGTDAVFRQCFEFGFFHADPHPGNLFALPGGRLCFIDCGMTGQIDQRTTEQLADLVAAVIAQDTERVIRVALALASVDPALADDPGFRSDTREFVSRFEQGNLDALDLGSLLQDFFDLLRAHRVRCPADLVFLIKAVTTIEGVGEQIDPTFDVVEHVRPHLERLLAHRYGFRGIRGRIRKSLLGYAELAESLPAEFEGLLGQIRGNRLSINLEHRRLDRLTGTIEHASRNISYATIIAALVVGSAILLLAGQMSGGVGVLTWVGLAGLAVAAFMGVSMVVINRWPRRKK